MIFLFLKVLLITYFTIHLLKSMKIQSFDIDNRFIKKIGDLEVGVYG